MRRKTRDTSYSMTQRLIKKYGVDELQMIWQKGGMYYAADYFTKMMNESVTPYVMRYLSDKFNWKRIVDESLPIVQGIKMGSMPANYYRHIVVPGVTQTSKNEEA